LAKERRKKGGKMPFWHRKPRAGWEDAILVNKRAGRRILVKETTKGQVDAILVKETGKKAEEASCKRVREWPQTPGGMLMIRKKKLGRSMSTDSIFIVWSTT